MLFAEAGNRVRSNTDGGGCLDCWSQYCGQDHTTDRDFTWMGADLNAVNRTKPQTDFNPVDMHLEYSVFKDFTFKVLKLLPWSNTKYSAYFHTATHTYLPQFLLTVHSKVCSAWDLQHLPTSLTDHNGCCKQWNAATLTCIARLWPHPGGTQPFQMAAPSPDPLAQVYRLAWCQARNKQFLSLLDSTLIQVQSPAKQ